MLPIIKCTVPHEVTEGKDVILARRECVSLDYGLSAVEYLVSNIVHRDTRNVLYQVSLSERKASQKLDRKYSITEMPSTNMESFLKKDASIVVRNEEETNLLLPLLPGSSNMLNHEFERQTDHKRRHQGLEDHRNLEYSKIPSLSKSSGVFLQFSFLFKKKSKGDSKILDISDYEILPRSDGCEIVQNCDPLETKGNEVPISLTVPGLQI
jgi:hypothetical protein